MASKFVKNTILALLILIGGWSLFQLLLTLLKKTLIKLGFYNPLWQYLIMFLLSITLISLLWHTGFKGAIKRIIRK